MRYFLDTEFNGVGGALISLALVPDDGEEFYAILETTETIVPWVAKNVIPFLDHVPFAMQSPRLSRAQVQQALSKYLQPDPEPLIVADWPEDISQFCSLLLVGAADMVTVPPLTFRLHTLPGFSTARNSAVPHNALHDARALREHICTHLE